MTALAGVTTAFPVVRAAAIEAAQPAQQWLIHDLWGRAAVGIIGGAPKCGKSWLGLDMAISVASGTRALDHFEVETPGPSLVYLAEDALPMVRARIDAICQHRHLDIQGLDVNVITVAALRLDLAADQKRLALTVRDLKPKMLLLDPLVRLHRLDENSASEISGLLGFLRELQRENDVAIVLVHHASKKHRAQPGQALRGSSDLHAFGDSNAYLAARNEHLSLTLEHRSAKAIDPLELTLTSRPDGTATHLALRMVPQRPKGLPSDDLENRTRQLLRDQTVPVTRHHLRSQLRINNERLGEVLQDLETRGLASRTADGWSTADSPGITRPTSP
jgi:hypothetical protein